MATTVISEDHQRTSGISSLRVPLISFPSTSMPVHHYQQSHQQQLLMQQEQPHHYRTTQPSFGICFDIDGVLARGTEGIPEAPRAIKKLLDDKGQVRVPVTFVTNSLSRPADRARQLTDILGIQVSADHVIQAPCPLKIFKGIQEKFCLVVGQGNILEIAAEVGFKKICTVEDVAAAYPLLDMVDHNNRQKISKYGYEEKPFQRVEAIVLMGEPKRWESSLQIIVDLLRTDGKPDRLPEAAPRKHLPMIACNMDLQFKDRAIIPRFGHGAFLICLEALYKKLTSNDLQYTALIGKPSEITFRFAEHVLAKESRRLGYTEPIKTMYLIGDTPEVDIAGCNLYQKYVDRLRDRRQKNSVELTSEEARLLDLLDPSLPDSRNVPSDSTFYQQTVERVVPLLVCTGVYKPVSDQNHADSSTTRHHHGHRDFPRNSELNKPAKICKDVERAVDFILEIENVKF